MARMKFLCDVERCIECNACVTACNNEHDVPWGINRRRVVTLKDGEKGEKSISVACMHCTDAPCAAVCPVVWRPAISATVGLRRARQDGQMHVLCGRTTGRHFAG